MPNLCRRACAVFEECYYSWHNGRKLSWDFTLGQGEAVGVFANKKKHVFLMTTLQLVVLLQFTRNKPLSVQVCVCVFMHVFVLVCVCLCLCDDSCHQLPWPSAHPHSPPF